LALGGTDEIARITPADDLASSRVERFLLPNGAHTLQATTFPLVPLDTAFDARGILWATLFAGNAIARIDPALVRDGTTDGIQVIPLAPCNTGIVCPPPLVPRLPPPPPGTPDTRSPGQLTVTQDAAGNTVVWFAEQTADAIGVLRATPAGAVLNLTDLPCQCLNPLGITLNADGSVWFTEGRSNKLGKFTPDPTHPFRAGTLDHFAIPSSVTVDEPGGPKGGFVTSNPHSIAFDPSGKAWFTEEVTGKVGIFDPVSGFTEMALPDNDFHAPSQPADLTIDRNGTVFVVDEYGDQILALTAAGVKARWRPLQRVSGTDKPTIDSQGNLWFAEGGASRLTRFKGVAAGPAFVPSVRPLLQADLTAGTIGASNLGTTTSAAITVVRAGAVAVTREVAVVAGSFVASGLGPKPGDVVKVALSDTAPRPALVMTVADVSVAVRPDKTLGGAALAGGRPLADEVSVAVSGQPPASAPIDPVTGSFDGGALRVDPASASGAVTWTGSTPVAVVKTVASFAPAVLATPPVVVPAPVPVPTVTPSPSPSPNPSLVAPAPSPAASPSPAPPTSPAAAAPKPAPAVVGPVPDSRTFVTAPPAPSTGPAAKPAPPAAKQQPAAKPKANAPAIVPAVPQAAPASGTQVADAHIVPGGTPTQADAQALDVASRPTHDPSPLFGLGMTAGFVLLGVLGVSIALAFELLHARKARSEA
jgi:streptogramin lyase